jgi:hypothetical protein
MSDVWVIAQMDSFHLHRGDAPRKRSALQQTPGMEARHGQQPFPVEPSVAAQGQEHQVRAPSAGGGDPVLVLPAVAADALCQGGLEPGLEVGVGPHEPLASLQALAHEAGADLTGLDALLQVGAVLVGTGVVAGGPVKSEVPDVMQGGHQIHRWVSSVIPRARRYSATTTESATRV